MLRISKRYKHCEDFLHKAGDNTKEIAEMLSNCYTGQASPILLDTLDKLREHTMMLKDCMNVMAGYVDTALANAQEADKKSI